MVPAAPPSYLSATLPLTNLQSQDPGRGLGPKQEVEAWILLDPGSKAAGVFSSNSCFNIRTDLLEPPLHPQAFPSSHFHFPKVGKQMV